MEPIDQEERQAGFVGRHRIKLVVAACSVVGIVLLMVFGGGSDRPARAKVAPQVVAITLPPPPPPPPPPPKPREPRPETAPREEQMIMQEAITEPEEAPSEAPAAAEASLGTGITGDGPADGFGLGTSGGGGLFGGGGGKGKGSGSRWGWYAGQVQYGVQTALGADPRTRLLALDVRVRIWVDETGRIERVELPSSGLPADVVASVREALVGVQLRQAAPADMPMPIVLRVNARRPA